MPLMTRKFAYARVPIMLLADGTPLADALRVLGTSNNSVGRDVLFGTQDSFGVAARSTTT